MRRAKTLAFAMALHPRLGTQIHTGFLSESGFKHFRTDALTSQVNPDRMVRFVVPGYQRAWMPQALPLPLTHLGDVGQPTCPQGLRQFVSPDPAFRTCFPQADMSVLDPEILGRICEAAAPRPKLLHKCLNTTSES